MVVNSRAKMNKFVMGVSNRVVNECRLVVLIPRIDTLVSWFMHNKLRNKKLKQVGRN